MHAWTIVATQNDDAWLDDYIERVLMHARPRLPSHDQKIGHVEAHWHQVAPGVAYIAANPDTGTADDRRLVEALVVQQLRPHGFKRAVYTVSDHKTATWDDVQENARQLVQNRSVQLLRNGYNSVVAQVRSQTQPGKSYKVEISRDDPNSQAITGSHCECDWGQFQNTPRTRIWKRFQDRPCKHIVAAYWQSLATPIDEERSPGDFGQQGQMSLPGMGGPMQAPGSMPLMQSQPPGGPQMGQPGPDTGMGAGGPQMPAQGVSGPSPADVLPPFPMDQSLQPQVNPSSVPGQRPGPTPTDPIQYPGGTFSSYRPVKLSDNMPEFTNGDLVQLRYDEPEGTLEGRSEEHGAGEPTPISAGQVGEVLGTHPSTGLVNVLYMGKPWDQNGPLMPYGATAWHFPSSLIPRPDLKKPGPALRRRR